MTAGDPGASLVTRALAERPTPLVLQWPVPGNPAALVAFETPGEWRRAIAALDLDARLPDMVRRKFARAQKLHLLGWQDIDLLKAGELAALAALELALTDRYGGAVKRRRPGLQRLLSHLVETEGLRDVDLPSIVACGGTALGYLTGELRPSLADRRNAMAHGDSFDGPPVTGLLHLVRDLVHVSYREYLRDAGQG
ncbi:hypothetical protein [Bosea sp. ASV33]|uniref:hypothetical protein n=1 Tax=Bosea sp. ASV33 TaxID=2795106 RepID=UPI0018EC1010|nr:hypothetical protein [Bosea sp. ASV33]